MRSLVIISLVLVSFSGLAFPAVYQEEDQERGGPIFALAKQLTEIFPEASFPHLLLGRAYMIEGQHRKAEKELERGLELDSRSLLGRLWLGDLHYNRGRWQRAGEEFAIALKLDPRSYQALTRLGQIAAQEARFEDAEKFLTQALEIKTDGYEALLQLGRVYSLRPESAQRAISLLKRAYVQRPEDPELNYQLGLLYYDDKKYSEAEYFFSKALSLKPQSNEYRLALGKCFYYGKKYDEALKELNRVAKSDRKNPESHYYIAGVLLAQEKYPKAAATFRKVNRLGQGYRDALFFLAKAEYHQGLHKRAYSDLLQYRIQHLKGNPADPAALAESIELMLEIEKILQIERRPNQLPGKIDPAFMVTIPGGSFRCGGPRGSGDQSELYIQVQVDACAIQRREVSNADYRVFVLATGWQVPRADEAPGVIRRYDWNAAEKIFPEGMDDLPVVNVSWEDAFAYAAWVGMRLPTEAEWEKAARGGLSGQRYPWGNRTPSREQACYSSTQGPRSVKVAEANGYGLQHVVGNAAEWCADWYEPDITKAVGDRINPKGPATGQLRAYRGGHWLNGPDELQIYFRAGLSPKARNPFVGFRCAADLPETSGE